MNSVSGLNYKQRILARDCVCQAAQLAYRHRDQINYTQGPKRWEGINKKCNARKGEFPRNIDCSAFATWCIWNGLYLGFNKSDTVNNAAWHAGYTGTMLSHGKQVKHVENALRGDCVIYGRGFPGHHTAIIVGFKNGIPMIVSHGSQAGPFYLPYNYRSDVMQIRRYI